MARDDTTPMTFELPDGDSVSLITWAYVSKKLEEELSEAVAALGKTNSYLERISSRADYWLEKQKEGD